MEITFILVEPKSPENIGSSARALKTMGFSYMRLVNPYADYQGKAKWLAQGSTHIIDNAATFSSLSESIADSDLIIATSAKQRWLKSDVINSNKLAKYIKNNSGPNSKISIVFGNDDVGLSDDEIAQCDAVSIIPMADKFPSLNLAQAVMLYAYELADFAKLQPSKAKVVIESTLEPELQLKEQYQEGSKPTEYQKLRNRLLNIINTKGDDNFKFFSSISVALKRKFTGIKDEPNTTLEESKSFVNPYKSGIYEIWRFRSAIGYIIRKVLRRKYIYESSNVVITKGGKVPPKAKLSQQNRHPINNLLTRKYDISPTNPDSIIKLSKHRISDFSISKAEANIRKIIPKGYDSTLQNFQLSRRNNKRNLKTSALKPFKWSFANIKNVALSLKLAVRSKLVKVGDYEATVSSNIEEEKILASETKLQGVESIPLRYENWRFYSLAGSIIRKTKHRKYDGIQTTYKIKNISPKLLNGRLSLTKRKDTFATNKRKYYPSTQTQTIFCTPTNFRCKALNETNVEARIRQYVSRIYSNTYTAKVISPSPAKVRTFKLWMLPQCFKVFERVPKTKRFELWLLPIKSNATESVEKPRRLKLWLMRLVSYAVTIVAKFEGETEIGNLHEATESEAVSRKRALQAFKQQLRIKIGGLVAKVEHRKVYSETIKPKIKSLSKWLNNTNLKLNTIFKKVKEKSRIEEPQKFDNVEAVDRKLNEKAFYIKHETNRFYAKGGAINKNSRSQKTQATPSNTESTLRYPKASKYLHTSAKSRAITSKNKTQKT